MLVFVRSLNRNRLIPVGLTLAAVLSGCFPHGTTRAPLASPSAVEQQVCAALRDAPDVGGHLSNAVAAYSRGDQNTAASEASAAMDVAKELSDAADLLSEEPQTGVRRELAIKMSYIGFNADLGGAPFLDGSDPPSSDELARANRALAEARNGIKTLEAAAILAGFGVCAS